MSIIEIAFVFVLILFIIESFLLYRRKEVKVFDVLSNLNYGLFNRIGYASYGVLVVFGYKWLYDNFRLQQLDKFHVQNTTLSFVFAYVVWDFCFYWGHRFSHTTKLGRFVHRCHHEGHEFNVSLAFRNGIFQQAFNHIFLYSMPLLGFSPEVFLQVNILNLLYQFFIHSKYMPELKYVNFILNDAHLHKLHHCYNKVYVDKNYAGTFIIWDRLFGSFVNSVEGETPKVGLNPKKYYDVLDSNFRFQSKLPCFNYTSKYLRNNGGGLVLIILSLVLSVTHGFANLKIDLAQLPERIIWVLITLTLLVLSSAIFREMSQTSE